MKYIVKDSEDKKMIMEVVGSMPQLPEGYEVLGLAEDLPDAIAEIELANQASQSKAEDLKFLNDTDFKVLRHIRQKALVESLSMTEEEYLAMEQLRSEAAARIST